MDRVNTPNPFPPEDGWDQMPCIHKIPLSEPCALCALDRAGGIAPAGEITDSGPDDVRFRVSRETEKLKRLRKAYGLDDNGRLINPPAPLPNPTGRMSVAQVPEYQTLREPDTSVVSRETCTCTVIQDSIIVDNDCPVFMLHFREFFLGGPVTEEIHTVVSRETVSTFKSAVPDCPFFLGTGTCVTGCRGSDGPACWEPANEDCPYPCGGSDDPEHKG